MTIATLPPLSGIAQLSLSSFRDSATKGENLRVVHDGSLWKVEACGTAVTERSGATEKPETDTTSAFIEALGKAFSRGIQDAVVRELELIPQPGQPLESRTVLRAIAMAEASQQAMEGVDFMTRLMFSAASQSAGFIDACVAIGLSPAAVSAEQRKSVDACMQERFAQAAHLGEFPVAPALAQQWLRAELMALNAHPPDKG